MEFVGIQSDYQRLIHIIFSYYFRIKIILDSLEYNHKFHITRHDNNAKRAYVVLNIYYYPKHASTLKKDA